MRKPKSSLYPPPITDLIAEKSAVLSKAQAFAQLGMADMASTLWLEAGNLEERLAPLLESLGHDLEAAVHRLSAAGCYQRAGNWTAAANLYRAGLAGPLLDHSRHEAKEQMAQCLAEISRRTFRTGKERRPHKARAKA